MLMGNLHQRSERCVSIYEAKMATSTHLIVQTTAQTPFPSSLSAKATVCKLNGHSVDGESSRFGRRIPSLWVHQLRGSLPFYGEVRIEAMRKENIAYLAPNALSEVTIDPFELYGPKRRH